MHTDRTPVYIRFLGDVDQDSVGRLMAIVEEEVAQGHRHFVLLLSTVGGSVWHGISAYNFLMGLPIQVATHNFGTVDSVGVVLYCAGAMRYASPEARFVLHAPFHEFGDEALGERQLAERLGKLRVDGRNMAHVIGREVGRDPVEVEQALRKRQVMDVAEARAFRLVHEVRSQLAPEGAKLRSVGHGPHEEAEEFLRAVVEAARQHRQDGTPFAEPQPMMREPELGVRAATRGNP